MIRGKVLTILAALLGVTAACSLGVAAYIIIQPGASPESGVAETEAQLAGVEIVDHTGEEEHIDNDALPNISVDSGAVWTDSEVSNPESVPEPEPAISEPEPESVIPEPEPEPEPEYQNPGTHGGYLHEVGGARFYTEHDINQWLRPNEKHPGHFNFDIYQMLVDIWCEDGGNILGTSDGYVRVDGGHTQEAIWFETIDTANSRLFHKTKMQINDQNGIEITSVEMHDCPGPYITDTYSVLDGYSHLIHKELAELVLYAAEQMVAGSPYEALSALNLGQNFSVY